MKFYSENLLSPEVLPEGGGGHSFKLLRSKAAAADGFVVQTVFGRLLAPVRSESSSNSSMKPDI